MLNIPSHIIPDVKSLVRTVAMNARKPIGSHDYLYVHHHNLMDFLYDHSRDYPCLMRWIEGYSAKDQRSRISAAIRFIGIERLRDGHGKGRFTLWKIPYWYPEICQVIQEQVMA